MTKSERERAKRHLYLQPGSQNWFCRFYLHGKQIRETTGTPDEIEASRFVLSRLDEVGADRSGAKKFIGPEQKRIRVSELLEALQVDYKLRGKWGARLLSNLKPLQEWFGSSRAMELTSALVDKFIEHALQHGRRKGADATDKPAKPASINRCLQLLGQAYKLAIQTGRLATAPHIRKLSERDNVRTGFFNDAEIRIVIANLPAHLQDFVLFAYLVGWRKNEIRSLLWAEVEADVIRLRAENSKNGESRIVTFETGELAELMERCKAARAVQTPTGTVQAKYIFHHKGQPIGDFRKSWATACKLAGAPGRLFHDLRRSAIREMLRAGIHETTARKISGHKTASMLQRYNIQSDADVREAMRLRETRIATQQQENRLAIPPATKMLQ
jgi:integrase